MATLGEVCRGIVERMPHQQLPLGWQAMHRKSRGRYPTLVCVCGSPYTTFPAEFEPQYPSSRRGVWTRLCR